VAASLPRISPSAISSRRRERVWAYKNPLNPFTFVREHRRLLQCILGGNPGMLQFVSQVF
jgi:hypothetical protein